MRKHADQIILWARCEDATVWCRSAGVDGSWVELNCTPDWRDTRDYVVVPKWADEYWEAWQAGTLRRSIVGDLWRRVVEPPLFDPEDHWKIVGVCGFAKGMADIDEARAQALVDETLRCAGIDVADLRAWLLASSGDGSVERLVRQFVEVENGDA